VAIDIQGEAGSSMAQIALHSLGKADRSCPCAFFLDLRGIVSPFRGIGLVRRSKDFYCSITAAGTAAELGCGVVAACALWPFGVGL